MTLKLLSTGVRGLDEVFGGGLPEYSFNLIAGAPGAGKTTLVHQITFANASDERPALYFTVLGEPSLKMLRYQQQMEFFDADKVGNVIKFIDLSAVVLEGDLAKLLDTVIHHVEETNPAIVVVDSFRTVLRSTAKERIGYELELQGFLQRLALHLTSWQVTSFLVGEYGEHEMHENPVFTIADAIVWMHQSKERSSIVRKLEVMKMRGRAPLPGFHNFRISAAGVRVFPRSGKRRPRARRSPDERASLGEPGFDALTGGGLPAGDATLLGGPSGTGKTALSTQFIAAGAEHGEPGVIAVFEEHPEDYLARAKDMGFDLPAMVEKGLLKILYLRPVDLSSEEMLQRIQDAVDEVNARRLVIDSLNGLELALAPNYREDFRESLYRMVGDLTASGVSMILTVEVTESFDQLRFSPHAISFLAQNLLFFRYVEIRGALEKVVAVIKMRRSDHSREIHAYDVTSSGIHVKGPLREYQGLLTGVPTHVAERERGTMPGLMREENAVLARLLARGEAELTDLLNDLKADEAIVKAALERLLALHYVIAVDEHERVLYRPIGRPLGG